MGTFTVQKATLAALLILSSAYGRAFGQNPYALDSRPQSKPFLNLPSDASGTIPALLSQTGAFDEIRTLSPSAALIPYDLNCAFWSDGAAKSRWIAVPRERSGNEARIRFAPTGEWRFPEGTVFVKHFELPVDETRPDLRRRLETRLLVCDSTGGVYGASYKWRPDHSDAEVVEKPLLEPITIETASGSRKQNWYYPGPEDCRKCHVASVGGVLGVTTRQLNRDYEYPTGITDNQLRTWNHLGLLEPRLDESQISHLARLTRPDDQESSLEDRARSFLDANCAYCHRPGGVVADFDARYDTPLAEQNLIDVPVRINLGIDRARFIAPNDPGRSMVLLRVDTTSPTKMPPLAHELIDRQGAELLRDWIKSLPGPPVVGPPTITPKGGDYKSAVRVSFKHDDPAAIIHYTLDGSAPRESSPAYVEPLEVTRPTTVRARAYKPGHTRSIAVHETFIIDD